MYITIMLLYTDSYLYWCLVYLCDGIFTLCIYVVVTSSYPLDRGVTGWYQSVGSHIFSTTNRQINGKEICNWNAWVVVIQSNYKYKVIYSLFTILPLILESLPSFSIFSSRRPYTNLRYGSSGIQQQDRCGSRSLFWHSLIPYIALSYIG